MWPGARRAFTVDPFLAKAVDIGSQTLSRLESGGRDSWEGLARCRMNIQGAPTEISPRLTLSHLAQSSGITQEPKSLS